MASAAGTSHIAAEQRCQDAHFHVEATGPDGERTMVLAVSDGAGTAPLAEVGAGLVCSTFGRLVAAYVGQGGRIENIRRPLVERWIAGLIYRLEMHAAHTGAALEDYACTLLAAAVGDRSAVFLQIGDGAIVQSVGGSWRYVFWPQHGEFANTTNFITSTHRLEALEFDVASAPVEELALFTDGLENLVLKKATRAVHAPFFESMFPPVRRSRATGVDADLSRALNGYLSSAPVNDRTDDDKTLIMASRRQA
ncbi:MAG: protein phosphatase 2C domain-containing protein [Enhydrobacter sp.]|nr:protein phosphatase 2C domain-containing protein [Enhydrobacter sp.]